MVQLKITVVALLAFAIATFAVDCGATMTAQEAAFCCKNMNCPSQGQNSQDCCKLMPSLHAPFVQTTQHEISVPIIAGATVPIVGELLPISTFLVPLEQSHAPPILAPPSQTPIRI